MKILVTYQRLFDSETFYEEKEIKPSNEREFLADIRDFFWDQTEEILDGCNFKIINDE